jgi:ADP-L-glycero-D-manno-heptose 6-epimerase
MKAIITGTKGFIGKNLLNRLSNDYECFEINEDIFDNVDWTKTLFDVLEDSLCHVIFHVGACSDTMNTDVNYMMTRNYEFTRIISEFCAGHDIPLIYSSSAANYGVNDKYPSNLYGWSKYTSEQHVIQNGGVALRYFNVYGPGEENKGRMASVAYQMIMKKNNGEPIKLFPLKPKRDFVYIDDVIEANIHAYKNYDEYRFSFFEVGSGESREFEDMMIILGLEYTYTSITDIPEGYQFFTKSDKTRWMSNWEPKFNLEDGLTEYLKKIKKV